MVMDIFKKQCVFVQDSRVLVLAPSTLASLFRVSLFRFLCKWNDS